MFSVLYGVVRPLHGDKPPYHGRAEKRARFGDRSLPYKRYISPAFRAVDVRQFADIQYLFIRHDYKSAVGIILARPFVFFDQKHRIVQNALALGGRTVKRKDVYVAAVYPHSVCSENLFRPYRSRMDKTLYVFYIFGAQRIGKNFERRNGFDFYVALVYGLTVFFARFSARAAIPRNFIERRSAGFAPYGRSENLVVDAESRVSRIKHGCREFGGFYVALFAARRPYAHYGSYSRKSGYSRIHYRSDMVVYVSVLPEIIFVRFFHFAARGDFAILIAA